MSISMRQKPSLVMSGDSFRTSPLGSAATQDVILRVQGLRKHFPIKGGLFGRTEAHVRAVDGVSFDAHRGETLGIVGESGCGKSTAARLLLRLIEPDAGSVILDPEAEARAQPSGLRELRRQIQMVFQDSYASLNPRLTIEAAITFGLKASGVAGPDAIRRAHDTLQMVGLRPEIFAERYPHELSGGQRQRVNIARALALRPRILVLDEAVSALDKSVEAQVLNLLQDLKAQFGLTYIFISHDLNVVRYISDRVVVMYLGKVIEIGRVDEIYEAPLHPYTRGLLSSRLSMNPRERITQAPLVGDPPNPVDPPSGCRFRTRCPIVEKICSEREPQLERAGGGHAAACHAHIPGSGHSLVAAT